MRKLGLVKQEAVLPDNNPNNSPIEVTPFDAAGPGLPDSAVEVKPDIWIIGRGSLCDKARELVEKHDALVRCGLPPVQTFILANGFFVPFFDRASERHGAITEESIAATDFNEEEMSIISSVLSRVRPFAVHEDESGAQVFPIAVRSSGEGDARGTGINKTCFPMNNPAEVAAAVKVVLGSAYCDDAREYQRVNSLGPKMDVIIQPVLADAVATFGRDKGFAPYIAGYAYTSRSDRTGYLSMVMGHGAAAVEGRGVAVDIGDGRSFYDIYNAGEKGGLYQLRDRIYFPGPLTKDNLLEPSSPDSTFISMEGALERGVVRGSNYPRQNFEQVFDSLARLQQELGAPQYVECAALLRDDGLEWHALQVADASVKDDPVEFPASLENVLFDGYAGYGNGVRHISKVLLINSARVSLEEIQKLNDEFAEARAEGRDGYVIVFHSGFVSMENTKSKPSFKHISNASAVLPVSAFYHASGKIIGHFLGCIERSNIFFGVERDSGAIERMRQVLSGGNARGPNKWMDVYTVPCTLYARKGRVVLIRD